MRHREMCRRAHKNHAPCGNRRARVCSYQVCRLPRESPRVASAQAKAVAAAAAPSGAIHAEASKLRSRLRALKSRPTHLGRRGFTPRRADESERKRAPEARRALQQPASRERSNHVASAQITTLQRADERHRSRRASCLARGACTPALTRVTGDRATLAPRANPHRC